ncbi:MAG: helix-turn-helix domain-containing protein [Bacteroidales bacterium]|nr:helix-turn-helix domain-containing protein [Bacteroidales bacterium]
MTNSLILQNIDVEGLKALIKEAISEHLTTLEPIQERPNYLTRSQVAERLNISLVTLNTYTKHGKIPAYRIGGRVLYNVSEVDAALNHVIIKSKISNEK